MLTGLALLALAALTALASLRFRSVLYPPALFAAIWTVILLSTAVLSYGTLTLKPEAIAVFVAGAVMFYVGGSLALAFESVGTVPTPVPATTKRLVQYVALGFNLSLLLIVPVFVAVLREAMINLDIGEFASAARYALSSADVAIPHWFQSVSSLGRFLAFACAATYTGTRRDRNVLLLSIPGPFVMALLTFSRNPIVALATGIAFILRLKGRVSARTLAVAGSVVFAIAMSVAGALHKGPDLDTGVSPIVGYAHSTGLYFAGGALGFSAVMDNPVIVGEPGLSLTFFRQIAALWGVPFHETGWALQEFTTEIGNVYTVYYNYWTDAGWLGVLTYACVAGFLTTLVYLRARAGSLVATVAFGIVGQGILMSGTADEIFSSPTPWILIVGFFGLLSAPAWVARIAPWRPPMPSARPAGD
jgi:oligosaccharide repeat unit polymerase